MTGKGHLYVGLVYLWKSSPFWNDAEIGVVDINRLFKKKKHTNTD